MTVQFRKGFKMAKFNCCFGQRVWLRDKKDSSENVDFKTPKTLKRLEGPVKHVRNGEMKATSEKWRFPGSSESETKHFSSDRMMLKMHSLSQVLFSRSRELRWWKLFLWNHRNLHSKMLSPERSFSGKSLNLGHNNNEDDTQGRNELQGGISGLWPQNQTVAFCMEPSPLARVDRWVKDLETETHLPDNYDDYDDNSDGGIIFPASPDKGKSPGRSTAHLMRRPDNLSEEILHASSLIQSLNSSSTVAHVSGIGLKAIPTISSFCSLRSANLSNNQIAHITPGSLPKGLHTLNLSVNKITTIEGLRELTRLRILDLSYNRISRIGQGLSNCTIIKELYLAGNKVSDVEGLHRLLKLTVLDLSFNNITTTKALGKLVANYNSLQALNLLGNQIQSNTSKDQLHKIVCGLLLKLAYLNKEPIKPQRAKEVIGDGVAKAALVSRRRSSGRKAARRVISAESSSSLCGSTVNSKQKRRIRSRTLSSLHASTSRGDLNKWLN